MAELQCDPIIRLSQPLRHETRPGDRRVVIGVDVGETHRHIELLRVAHHWQSIEPISSE